MVETKHDRDSSNNSSAVSNFFTMVSSGHNLSTIPALRNFAQLQNVEVIEEPKLFSPFEWYKKRKPNIYMLRDWAEIALTNCKPQVCSSSNNYRIELSSTDISGVYVGRTDLSHINLSESDIRNAMFRHNDMQESNLSSVIGSGARFAAVDLSGSIFDRAKLEGANFTYAGSLDKGYERTNLENTDFTKANLRDANLDYTILNGADLSKARLQGATFNNAKYSSATQFPDGFNPEKFNMELVEH